VIEATGPVDAAFDRPGGDRTIDDVQNVVVFEVANVQDVGFPQLAEVVRLAAGRGIKLSLIEKDAPAGSLVSRQRVRERLAA